MKEAEKDMSREKQEAEKAKAELDKKGPALKEDDRRRMEAELRKKLFNLQRKSRNLKNDLSKIQRDTETRILKEVQAVIAEIAKSEKIAYIFEKSQVLYSNQVPDITNKVIELYNTRAASAKTAKDK
jgi:outer membrane protein